MRAIIIAGGSGTRLRPLTYNTPKPMVPLFNKPFLRYQLELLKRHGVTEVIINLHYLSEVIKDAFGDGSELGMSIRYSLEDKPMGTAGAVKLAQDAHDAAGTMHVFHMHVRHRGRYLAQAGHTAREAVDIRHGEIDLTLVGRRQQVQHGIGRASHGDVQRHGVLKCLEGGDAARRHAGAMP